MEKCQEFSDNAGIEEARGTLQRSELTMGRESPLERRRANMARRLRLVMAEHAPMVSATNPEVSAVGVAWRHGELSFVVQAQSPESAAQLKLKLPTEIEGFPLATEVSEMAEAADFVTLNGTLEFEPPVTMTERMIQWISKLFRKEG